MGEMNYNCLFYILRSYNKKMLCFFFRNENYLFECLEEKDEK